MTAGFVSFSLLSQKVAYRYRTLYVLNALINGTAAISYFAMATGIGGSITREEKHNHFGSVREVLVPRYVDWAITTPLLLLDLTLLAGLPVGEILIAIFADLVMIFTGLISALHQDLRYRWGFYVFSCSAMLYVFYALVGSARSYAFVRSPKVGALYNQLSLALIVLWTGYPIAFFLGEGKGIVSADVEVLIFAVLDVLAKPVWGFALIASIPEEGHVLLPESLATPIGSGYNSLSQESREDA